MNLRNAAAIAVCLVVFLSSFLLGEGASYFFNLIALLIVLSGTVGATFMSYPFDDLRAALQVAVNAYRTRPPTGEEIVETFLEVSVKSHDEGFLSIQEAERQTTVTFLKDVLGMIVDGFTEKEIHDILSTEMHFFRQRRQRHERVFRHMARLAPSFGVAGSVVGLIAMLVGLGDTGVILKTIPLALTSTLYGILLGSFLLTPVAENIHFKTQRELLLQKLVLDGVAAIMQERNADKLQKKLESFLTPAQRPANQRTFLEIRRKIRELRLEGQQS